MHEYRTFPPPHLLSPGMDKFLRTGAGCDFTDMLDLLPASWAPILMGGLPRNLLMNRLGGAGINPVDADIVVFGAGSIDDLRSKLRGTVCSTNTFGGIKCQLRRNGMVFDLWRAEDHTNMPKSPAPTVRSLLEHNLLNVDAVAWEPGTGVLHDLGCLDSIAERRIDLVGKQGISDSFLAAQAAHMLIVVFKTGFEISVNARAFLADASARSKPGEIARILQRKQPASANQIQTIWNRLLSGGTVPCQTPRVVTR